MSDLVSVTTKRRDSFWDNVKGIMIFLVVFGHLIDYVTYKSDICRSAFLCIYAFHMPVMMFISGRFYSEKNTRRKIIFYVMSGYALKMTLTLATLPSDNFWGFSLLREGSVPWYFFALAQYQLLMYLLRGIDKKYLAISGLILACFVGYDNETSIYLNLSRMVIFFPIYLLGNITARKDIAASIKKHIRILVPLAVVILVTWVYFCIQHLEDIYDLRYFFTGRNSFFEPYEINGPLIRLLCYGITFLTSFSVLVLIPKGEIKFLTAMGRKTINVFFWHRAFIILMIQYLELEIVYDNGYMGKICFILISILLTVVLSMVKIFDQPLKIMREMCFKEVKE